MRLLKKLIMGSALFLGAVLFSFGGFSALWAFDLGFAKEDAGQPGAFLDFAASARSLAMGHAHTAMAEDAAAAYWNPAGLSRLDRKDIVTLYANLAEGTGFGYFSFAQPTLRAGTFGLSYVDLRTGGIEKRDSLGNRNGAFDSSEMAVLFSHGINVKQKYSVGSTVKVVRQDIDSNSATGFGLDLGGMWYVHPRWQVGLVLRNLLAPRIKLKSSTEVYPRDIRVGSKFQAMPKLVLATDLSRAENRSLKVKLGGEYSVNKTLRLRAGINETEVTAGMGIQVGDWGIDYAFGYNDAVRGEGDLGGSHRFGLHVNFGDQISVEEEALKWQTKGQDILASLKELMDHVQEGVTDEMKGVALEAREAINHNGYPRAQNLNMAQGYVSFLEGDFKRSSEFLREALSNDPHNHVLASHLEKAHQRLSQEERLKAIDEAMSQGKEYFEKGKLKAAITSFEQVLSFDPDNVEAVTFLDDVKKRFNEPILRELKIANLKFEKEEYLDVIKHLQIVTQLDPANKKAEDLMAKTLGVLDKQQTTQITIGNDGDQGVYEIDPEKAEMSRHLYNQGIQYYSKGELRQAKAALSNSLSNNPQNTSARNAYNRILQELEQKK